MKELWTIRVPVKVLQRSAFSIPSGLVPNVTLNCPILAVPMDTRTEIICDVTSSSFALIKWFYNEQAISKSSAKVDTRSCNQTLKIKHAKTSDGGNYTCQVSNSHGSVTKSCRLKVKGKATPSVPIV